MTVASDLRELAKLARRLPPPNHRKPDAFHEARSELARAMDELAARIEKGER